MVKARNRGEAREAGRHVREFRDQKRREDFKTKIGFIGNSQKHYRDPLLQVCAPLYFPCGTFEPDAIFRSDYLVDLLDQIDRVVRCCIPRRTICITSSYSSRLTLWLFNPYA